MAENFDAEIDAVIRNSMAEDLLFEFNQLKKLGAPDHYIQSNLEKLKRQLEKKHGIPFSMASGGEASDDVIIPGPSPDEYNRGPRVETDSGGIGRYIPPEFKRLGRNALDFLNMIDPVQGLMAGMRDSGRAFDTDLSPEERKQAAISAALETTFAATPVAAAKLMKAPAKTALIDALTVTGAPSSMADDISDPSRRAFIKGAAATTGIAALAPEVITEALEKVPAAVKRVKPRINPIDMFAKNIKVLRDEVNEAYEAADELPENLPDDFTRRPYDEAIAEAEKLHMDLEATTEMDLREVFSEIGPKEIAGANDESLEELSQALTDFRIYSEEEYIEEMVPLAEEIEKRGLIGRKDENGIPQYPYARAVVEDVQDHLEGSKTSKDTFGVYGPPDKAEGGEMRKGVGSLNAIARDMNFENGGEAVLPASTEYRRSLFGTESSGGRMDLEQSRTKALGASQAIPKTLEYFKESTGREFTREEFTKSASLQNAFQDWYEQTTLDYIADKGLDSYIGQVIKGVPVTLSGMMAVAHLGGNNGLRKFLETDGRIDPTDNPENPEQGTRLSDYMETHGGLNVYGEEPVEKDREIMSTATYPKDPMYNDPTYSDPMYYMKPKIRPTDVTPTPDSFNNNLNESLRPQARPVPQNLQEKYSPEGIEQMLIGTTAESLLPKPPPQG